MKDSDQEDLPILREDDVTLCRTGHIINFGRGEKAKLMSKIVMEAVDLYKENIIGKLN